MSPNSNMNCSLVVIADQPEWRHRKAGVRQEHLFAHPVLRGVQHGARRANRSVPLAGLRRRGRDVLELERDHVHAARELRDTRRGRRTSRCHLDVGHLPGRRVLVGRESVDAVAHAPGGDREHAPELAAAEHADGRAREDRRSCERVLRDSFAVCSSRKCAQPLAQLRPRSREDRDGQQRRVASRPPCRSPACRRECRRASARSRAASPCPSSAGSRRARRARAAACAPRPSPEGAPRRRRRQ